MVVRVILDYLLFVMHLQHFCQILTEVLRDKHYILLTDEDTKAQEVISHRFKPGYVFLKICS